MHMRNDAFQALAEFSSQIQRILDENGGERSVATIGKVDISPGAANVVPGRVDFSLEVRGTEKRVLADVPNTFRFASTAPYYVEIGDNKHHLNTKSIQFFRDWVDERIERIDIKDPVKREEVLKYHRKAQQFWQQRLARAKAGTN